MRMLRRDLSHIVTCERGQEGRIGEVGDSENPQFSVVKLRVLLVVAGEGFEPPTFGL